MPFFPVDDKAHSADVFRTLPGPIGPIGLWAMAGSYCMAYLTDGSVPAWFVDTWPGGKKAAECLVNKGVWCPTDDGYQFIEWPEHITAKHIEQQRKGARDRKRKERARLEQLESEAPPDEQ